MANLSQIKREKMLAFLEALKEQHDDDESLMAINQIEKELTSKKYGLVWEEHEEEVDVKMQTHIPVFTEVKEKEIVSNSDSDECNFLLEGDNLHSLKLLEKTHKGKIDVIYIDPPYNTGGKDFIYNDTYIGKEDGYQHSKWLSFIKKRLVSARKLLSKKGVLAISIGYQEVNSLMLLCQELFVGKVITCVTVQTSSGNAVANGFTYMQEYIVFVVPMIFLPNEIENDKKVYASPYHGMNLAGFNQTQRPNQTYPIFVDNNGLIVGCGKSLQQKIDEGLYEGKKEDFIYDYADCPDGTVAIWPITQKGDSCVWRLIPERLLSDWEKGYIKVVPNKKGKNKYTIQYLSGGIIEQIENGKLKTAKLDEKSPTLEVVDFKTAAKSIPTIWTDKKYLTANGSKELKSVFDKKTSFLFPKPLALIKDVILRVAGKKAIVLDFFAGSGTTGQAVMELNQEDGGNRHFILCTNNENNICEEVTYPRLKTVITGKREDGSTYSDGLPANLKYYKTDFVAKDSEEIYDDLLVHIEEMIQLQYGIKIDKQKYVIIMDDDEMDEFERNFVQYDKLQALFINQDVLLSSSQEKLLNNVNTYMIPDCYFDFELREAGELW